MERTERYKLLKPGQDDHYNVQDFNDNADAIDAALGGHDEAIEGIFKIGDIRLTQRTDLGDEWLLCNGEPFDPNEYPELAGTMPGLEIGVSSAAIDKAWTPPSTYSPCKYASDGVRQLMAVDSTLPSSNAAYLLWSDDNFKTHTQTKFGAGHTFPFYVNGHWIIFCTALDNNNNPYKTYVSSGEFGEIAWSGSNPPPTLSVIAQAVNHVEYIGGTYYAFCLVGSRSAVLACDSPAFDAVRVSYANSTVSGSGNIYHSFLRADGKFVFIRYRNSTILDVSWSEEPATGYQTRTPANNSGVSGALAPRSFQGYVQPIYQDGKIFWADGNTIVGGKRLILPYLEGIESGGFNYVNLMDAPASDTVDTKTTGILRAGKEYVFFWCDIASKKYWLLSGTNLLDAGTWTKYVLSPSYATGGALSYVCAQYIHNGILSAFTTNGCVLTVPTCALPRIGVDNCHAYIKAK